MTCIIGLVVGPNIYMGSDSMAIRDGSVKITTQRPKVFHREGFLFGCCGSPRQTQLLQYTFQPPPHFPEALDVDTYISGVFTETIRELYRDTGFTTYHDGMEFGGHAMVAYRGHLYEIGSDYHLEPIYNFTAIGSGGEMAFGAMEALAELPPEDRIIRSLEIVAKYDPHVGPPFYVEQQSTGELHAVQGNRTPY